MTTSKRTPEEIAASNAATSAAINRCLGTTDPGAEALRAAERRTLTLPECLAYAALGSWRANGPRTLERLEALVHEWAALEYGARCGEPEIAAVITEARVLALLIGAPMRPEGGCAPAADLPESPRRDAALGRWGRS